MSPQGRRRSARTTQSQANKQNDMKCFSFVTTMATNKTARWRRRRSPSPPSTCSSIRSWDSRCGASSSPRRTTRTRDCFSPDETRPRRPRATRSVRASSTKKARTKKRSLSSVKARRPPRTTRERRRDVARQKKARRGSFAPRRCAFCTRPSRCARLFCGDSRSCSTSSERRAA